MIRDLRHAIANDAKVRYMPPVSIDPAVWTPGGDVIVPAAGGVWPSINGGNAFGVLVGAGVALSRDAPLVRALLAHEFAHCFMVATKIIDHLDFGGELDLTGDPMDEARENQLLPVGSDWFGEADAKLIRWRDPRLKLLDAEPVQLANAGKLPLTAPPLTARGVVVVPPEWAGHIRSLRTR